MDEHPVTLHPIGFVESPFLTPLDAPRQGEFARAEATVHVHPRFVEGLTGVEPGMQLLVVWWAHEADRSLLTRPGSAGVFTMRTPHRPNPVCLSEVRVERREGHHGERLVVTGLEAVNGSPVLDLKSARPEFDGWSTLPLSVGNDAP